MARAFQHLPFEFEAFQRDLNDFRELLAANPTLSEQKDILPFFHQRPQLAVQIATFIAELQTADEFVFEFNLFGEFFPDLVVSKQGVKHYCFIEFEDASPSSLFRRIGKGRPSFGARFEQGYSQIVDWFCKLDEMQLTYPMRDLMGYMEVEYHGILIVGRSQYLNAALRRRIDWRSLRTMVNMKRINIFTYDDVYELLKEKLETILLYRGT